MDLKRLNPFVQKPWAWGWKKRLLVVVLVVFPFVGIDIQPTFSEHESGWLPVPFLKHRPTLAIVFESPIDSGDIMRRAVPSESEELSQLERFCAVRFGEDVARCMASLREQRENSGFYLPE